MHDNSTRGAQRHSLCQYNRLEGRLGYATKRPSGIRVGREVFEPGAPAAGDCSREPGSIKA
eukprot:1656104-Rhodomonas_salina.2